ncbi:hypothetical protein JW905_10700, partial [bacterium]|nr:hypothetical protein [candidate division CSSED10-310 bacterium]
MRMMKHNPGFLEDLDPNALTRAFVVRNKVLSTILRIISENTGSSNQHVLLLGHRGMGKTMLLHRVRAAVRDDPELSAGWLPILFPEEKYGIYTVGEFFLEVVNGIAAAGIDTESDYKALYESLWRERDETTLRRRCLNAIRELARSQHKRVLIMVENLNMIIGEQVSDELVWDLRQPLLNEEHIMVLGTSTCRFDGIDDSNKALYGFFREMRLQPLDDEECRLLWESVAGEPLPGNRVGPVRVITGGNPRLVAIMAGTTLDGTLAHLREQFARLVDDNTTYFKSAIEDLPPLERKVFAALAELWEPATARRTAERARLDVNKTSALLKRLVGRGMVRTVSGGNTQVYEVAERLFNIYYLMRQSRGPADRMKRLIDYMALFYQPETLLECVLKEAEHPLTMQWEPLQACRYVMERYELPPGSLERVLADRTEELRASVNDMMAGLVGRRLQEREDSRSPIDEIERAVKELFALFNSGNFSDALESSAEVLEKCVGQTDRKMVQLHALVMALRGEALWELGKTEEALVTYDELVDRHGLQEDTSVSVLVAKALFNKGVRLGALGRTEEEIAVYEAVDARYGGRAEAG